jgi:capsular exopolysaccharide synthesis family protein
MTFLDYFNIALKRWKIIVLSTLIGSVFGLFMCFLIPKVYEANGKLLISQDNMSIMGSSPLEDIMLSSLGKSDPLTTQTEILKTRPILMGVIDTLRLKDKKGFALDPEDFIDFFKFSIIRNTNLVDIRCRYGDADTAALFVNILAQVFVENNQQMNQEMVKTAKDFIENQLVSQKLKVEESEQNLIKFKEKAKTVSLDKEEDVNIEAYSNLNVEYIKTQADLNGAVNQQKSYRSKISSLHSESNPQYPLWVASSEQVDNLIVGMIAKRDAIKKQLDLQKRAMMGIPLTEAQLIGLIREQRIANEIYTSLLSKYEEYKIQEAAKIGSAKIIEPAISPAKSVIPKKKMFMFSSFLLGFFVGIIIIFGIEYFKGLPHSVEEIKHVLGYSLLGIIPYQPLIKKFLFSRDEPSSVQSEAIRIIQTGIKFKIQENEGRGSVILITSTHPGEGKSTVAANLAYSYSSNKKTLLMGMDFRRPSFNKIFGDTLRSPGITDTFENIENLIKAIRTFDKLGVIGPGTLPPNPLDLVQSKRMVRLIDDLRNKYEVIIIDSAPVTLVAETLEIIKFVDTVAMVVDMSSVSLSNLHFIKGIFDNKKTIPGIIVNKYCSPKAYYYKYTEYNSGEPKS